MIDHSISQPPHPLAAPAHARFELRTLGSREILGPEAPTLDRLRTRPKALAVLFYLALARPQGLHRRDTLSALFWPESDTERARASLRKALFELRAALGDAALRIVGDEEVGLDPQVVSCDAALLERAIERGDDDSALELYRGELLPGFFVREAPEFEAWLARERWYLSDRASEAAQRSAMTHEREGRHDDAVRCARRAAELSYPDERRLRDLLTLLERLGDVAGALQAADEFERRLRVDLETVPSAPTQALMKRLRERPEIHASASESALAGVPILPMPLTVFVGKRPLPMTPGGVDSSQAPASEAVNVQPVPRRRTALLGVVGAMLLFGYTGASGHVEKHARARAGSATSAGGGQFAPQWVIIADFEAATEYPPLAPIAQGIVTAVFQQSRDVAVVPGPELRQGRRSVGVPDTTSMTPQLAREIAMRGGVEVVITADAMQSDSGFQLVLRAIRADSGTTVEERTALASTPDEYLAAADRLGRELEAALAKRRGRRESKVSRSVRVWPVTPSYGAYQQYFEAMRARSSANSEQGPIPHLREALRIDSTFVAARMYLAVMFINLGMRDSARATLAVARRHVDPRDEYNVAFIRAYEAAAGNVREEEMHAWQHVLQRQPWSPRALGNLGATYERLQRYEEAIETARRSLAIARYGRKMPDPVANMASAMMALGRWDDARREIAGAGFPLVSWLTLGFACATEDWRELDRIAQEQLSPANPPASRRRAAIALASRQAVRGDIARSVALVREASRFPVFDEAPASTRWPVRGLLILSLATGDSTLLPHPRDVPGQDAGQRILAGVLYALRGEGDSAIAIRESLRGMTPDERYDVGYGPQLLDAILLARAERWPEALARFEPVLSTHSFDGNDEQLWLSSRWLAADAFESAGRPQFAVRALEMIVDPVETWRNGEIETRGLALNFARQRLAVLYRRLGRHADAERHALAMRSALADGPANP